MKTRIGCWTLLKLVIVTAILAVMVWKTDLSLIPELIGRIDVRFLAVSFGLYLCMFVIGAIRCRVMLGMPVRSGVILPVVMFQNIANQFLPARAGDVTYLAMLNRTAGVPVTRGISSILLVKFCDIIAIIVMLAVSAFLLRDGRGIITAITLSCGIYLFLLFIVAALMIKYLGKFGFLMGRAAGFLRLSGSSFGDRVLDGLENTADSFTLVNNKRVMVKALFWTAVYWVLPVSMAYVNFVYIFRVPVTFYQLFYLHTVLSVFSAVPVHFFGGLGTMDISLAAMLVMFGVMDNPESIALSLSLRAVMYVFAAACLLTAFLALKVEKSGNVEVLTEKMYDDGRETGA